MSGGSFPDLTLVELGRNGDATGQGAGRPSTGPLEAAAGMLTEVRDYLFSEAEQPTSPANMAQLRGFLERVYGYLITVTTFYDADEENGTSDQGRAGSAEISGTRPAASQGIREAGQAVREMILTARKCTRVTKQVAEDWEILRTDLDRSPDNRRAHYRALLDSQQEVEDSISALAGLLRKFVQIVTEIGEGGSASVAAGHSQHTRSRGRVMDGRPHYIPWQPRVVGRAS